MTSSKNLLNAGFSQVRVRFAPSPTGYLHVGGARSALFNYAFAKKNNGKFILRIEDTDVARSSEESLRLMVQDLKWLGLNWDEGVDPETLKDVGDFGPYRQSQRLELYKNAADQLLKSGQAYYCFMTDEDIEQQRKAIGDGHAHLISPYADWTFAQAEAELKTGKKAVVRFRTKDLKKDYTLQDLIRGEVKFPTDMVGDFVLLRSDGMPVYNFCCVVDDYYMKISHVLRAEEHLPNTLRQLMIYEGMGWSIPQFGHISLVLDDDRQKLSKRKGAASCDVFKNEGYLPSAMINFLSLLGWSHPAEKDIFDLPELVELFDLERLNSSGAVFDRVKLKWTNAQHLRQMSNQELWKMCEKFLIEAGIKYEKDLLWQQKSIEVFKPKMEILSDAVTLYKTLDESQFKLGQAGLEVLTWEPTVKVLQTWIDLLNKETAEFLSDADFARLENEVKVQAQVKGKNLFQPMRVAVIGEPNGPELKLLVPLIRRSSLVKRAEKTLGSKTC